MKINRIFRIIAIGAAALTTALVLSACSHRLDSSSDAEASSVNDFSAPQTDELDKSKSFVIALYPEYAPITAANFEKLVSNGFYDGLVFHRIYKGFMAQGGDGTTAGRDTDAIKGEFKANGFDNTLSHDRGVVSMARTQVMDSASSQFFIVYDSNAKLSLDGLYASFGKVIEGMEVVDSFLDIPMEWGMDQALPTHPTEPITILKAVIDGKDSDGHTLCRFYMQVGNK